MSTISGKPVLASVEAPKTGTQWHRERKWFEAKTEAGHVYYWHVETNQSRWDAPKEGFFSIEEQEDVNKKHEAREAKKAETIYMQQALHGEQAKMPYSVPDVAAISGPISASGPVYSSAAAYGQWRKVEKKYQTSATYDFQAPAKREKKAVVNQYNDVLHFQQRSTPSMSSAGSSILDDEDRPAASSSTALSFGFKKRKLAGSDGGGATARKRNFRQAGGTSDE